ncbi:MAG: hypothetical protein WBE34_12090, partial [Candidatus Nitrosopolaris sp.]
MRVAFLVLKEREDFWLQYKKKTTTISRICRISIKIYLHKPRVRLFGHESKYKGWRKARKM